MIKIFRSAYLIIFLLLGGMLGQASFLKAQEPEMQPLDQLRDRFRGGQIFHANFTHIYQDSYTKQSEKSEGEVWVGDNEYKVKAQHQRVLVFNGISRVYDGNKNRVVISKYDPQEDDFAPSKFLTGTDTLYTVRSQETEADTVRITMRSEDPFTVFKEIEIRLDTTLKPMSIKAIDQADNTVLTRFNSGSFLKDETGIFELEYPDDAKIIDLRE